MSKTPKIIQNTKFIKSYVDADLFGLVLKHNQPNISSLGVQTDDLNMGDNSIKNVESITFETPTEIYTINKENNDIILKSESQGKIFQFNKDCSCFKFFKGISFGVGNDIIIPANAVISISSSYHRITGGGNSIKIINFQSLMTPFIDGWRLTLINMIDAALTFTELIPKQTNSIFIAGATRSLLTKESVDFIYDNNLRVWILIS